MLRSKLEALAASRQEGDNGQDVLCRSAALIDDTIADKFNCGQAAQQAGRSIAVVALGGYGRREFFLHSGINLLLLHDRQSEQLAQEAAEALLRPLRDEGLDVSHSVCGIEETIQCGLDDFLFQIALLDARLITGSSVLFDELRTQYARKILDGRRLDFVRKMDALQQERWRQFSDRAYLLEPHIKEGKGGLRDIQAMGWVAKGVFGLPDLAAIRSSGMLEAANWQPFESALSMLLRIRNRLHLLGRRKNDHLTFGCQQEVARAFEYQDTESISGVECFMRDVHSHLQTVAMVTDLFFEHVREVMGLTAVGSLPDQQLERGIVLRGGTVRLASVAELTARPLLLMRLFLQAGKTGAPLHHRTRQSVVSHLFLVDDRFRSSKRVAKTFFDLLTRVEPVFPVLEDMLATGLLTGYFPELAEMESPVRHDLYHLHVVDRHALRALDELNALRREEADVFAEVGQVEALFLAAFLRNVGAGHQSGRSAPGAEMAAGIGGRLHLSEESCAVLAFLLRHSLSAPESALRCDCSDRTSILRAAELIGDAERLAMLYLLAAADARGTEPSSGSGWRMSALAEWYAVLRTCFGPKRHPGQEDAAQKDSRLREQILARLDGQSVRMDVRSLPADYLHGFSMPTVLRHLRMHTEMAARLSQQILLFPEPGEKSWQVLIMGPDRIGLLAKLCGVLALHHLTIWSARVCTWPDGTVVDAFEAVSTVQRSFAEMNWQNVEQDINLAVNYRLDVGYQLHERGRPQQDGRGRRPAQAPVRKVVVDNQTSRQDTVIEVACPDHRDALYQLTQTLADNELSIRQARIAVDARQLTGVFFVQTEAGDKLVDAVMIDKVRMTLMHVTGEDMADAAEAT